MELNNDVINNFSDILDEAVMVYYNALKSETDDERKEVENANYLNKIIENQNNIDNLDAVSGSTKTSNGLKNIVKAITEEENEK